MGRFTNKTKSWEKNFPKRFNQVAQMAVSRMANDAGEPIAKGGRMPVDTGFLRASVDAEVGRMPSGQSKNTSNAPVAYTGAGLTASILRWNAASGEPLYIGWVAQYARPMEYKYGFMRGAAEKWDGYVDGIARRARLSGL